MNYANYFPRKISNYEYILGLIFNQFHYTEIAAAYHILTPTFHVKISSSVISLNI